jgi:hypothetical protein
MIGEFTSDLWMTNYEASFFVGADRVAAVSTCRANRRRIKDVA